MATETDEAVDKLSTGEAGTVDDVAESEVRHKAVTHKTSNVLRSGFID